MGSRVRRVVRPYSQRPRGYGLTRHDILLQSTNFPKSREQLWVEYFSDPSRWLDNRLDKRNPKCPDFVHRQTKEMLWIETKSNPHWVKVKLANLAYDKSQSQSVCTQKDQLSVYNRSAEGPYIPPSKNYPNCDELGIDGDLQLLCKENRLKEAVHVLDLRDELGIRTDDADTYASLLQRCTAAKALAEGMRIHAHLKASGCRIDTFLGNTLINMYVKCGRMAGARRVFNAMPERNTFTWTMMIAGYAKRGRPEKAVKLFGKMAERGIKPDEVTFVTVLNACGLLCALERVRETHSRIVEAGMKVSAFVGSALVDVYSQCGSLINARNVFNTLPDRNLFTWTTMIAGYAKHGPASEAIKLFRQMGLHGMKPDEAIFLSVLNACAILGELELGRRIHDHVTRNGSMPTSISLGNTLINMYSKCGSMEEARKTFEEMSQRDVATWNAMIGGYACQSDYGHEAITLYRKMKREEGVKPDRLTFINVLNACSSMLDLEQGRKVYAKIIKSGLTIDPVLGKSVIDMFVKCGSVVEAKQVLVVEMLNQC